jgi:hypothetical protein
MFPANRKTNFVMIVVCAVAAQSSAGPGDLEVERFLREHRMGQLLEVQLESRLEQTEDTAERAEIAASLSALYLAQLRAVDRTDPYREIVIYRAQSLVDRVSAAPMHELQLELLVDRFVKHENAIELAQIELLGQEARGLALGALREMNRELRRLLNGTEQELDRLSRRRSSARTLSSQGQIEDDVELLRRLNSFGNYYLGWSGYGIAVLEARHVERDTYHAFGWLLGADGGIPVSRELSLAALEFEHVARAAIGIAMCDAQSENYDLAQMWLEGLIASEVVPSGVSGEARRRLLRVHTQAGSWFEALKLAIAISSDDGDGQLSIADARFVAIESLESRRARENEDARKLVTLCIEQLVDQREIGHVVDLYQRYQNLPMIGSGFIPMYARALAELERTELGESGSAYSIVIDLLNRAIGASDADTYPQHRDDCRLKMAYALVRDDKPKDAIEQCQRVLDTSLDADSLEEARWIRIAALDHANVLEGRRGSNELEDAIRSYIGRYPGTQRARTLVLRYALQGVLDPQEAIATLSAVPDGDPSAHAARRLQAQLQYEILRDSGFSDAFLLNETLDLLRVLIVNTESGEGIASRVSVLQIAIDLTLRASPPSTDEARAYIEQARSMIASSPLRDQLEPELVSQLIRVCLLDGQVEKALVHLDELELIEPARGRDAQVLILNHIITSWESEEALDTARLLVEIGAPVISRVTPPMPERIGVQQSALMEAVAHAADALADGDQDNDMRLLAMRLCQQVLTRGQPSEPGLRRTASIADELAQPEIALEAWLRLLAAYPEGDERWYEARYESLVFMNQIDPARAQSTFDQFQTLNPTLGPSPWREQYEVLFSARVESPQDGGQP